MKNSHAVARLLWMADTYAGAMRWRRLLRSHQTHIAPASNGQWACYALVSDWFFRHETAEEKAVVLASSNPEWRLEIVSLPLPEEAA